MSELGSSMLPDAARVIDTDAGGVVVRAPVGAVRAVVGVDARDGAARPAGRDAGAVGVVGGCQGTGEFRHCDVSATRRGRRRTAGGPLTCDNDNAARAFWGDADGVRDGAAPQRLAFAS